LIHQERQHHQHGKHDGQMLLAMPKITLEMIALIFERIEGFVLGAIRGIKNLKNITR